MVSNNHTGVSGGISESPNTNENHSSGGDNLERRIHSQPTSDE